MRRRRTTLWVIDQPHGPMRYRWVDAGWLQVSTLGPWPVVVSRTGAARQIRGRVTDDPDLPAVRLIPTDETRWAVALFCKDAKPLLGLGHDQNRAYGATGIHRHLVGFADALLTHLRMTRHGAQGQRLHNKAADWSLAAAQDHLRGLLWDDGVAYLEEKHHDESVLKELERLRVAS